MSCLSPYYRIHNGSWIPLPCGRCPPCKKRRVDGWVFRLLQEDKISTSARFITLTYAPEHLPISQNGHMTLDKTAFPLYMKRLRKLCPDCKLKYYACGEYGSEYSRPHYHAIVFNVPDDEMFFKAWSIDGKALGIVDVGQVSSDSIAYVAGYINKQQGSIPRRDDDRVSEFCLMSKGLGSSYITDEVIRYHKSDLSRNHLTKDGGDIIAMPRYYRDRIFDPDEQSIQQGLAQLAVGVSNSEQYENFLTRYGSRGDYTFDMYQEALKLGEVDKFYKNQKTRSI